MIQLGQFIRLDSGEEGYVEKIGWRSTWIKLAPNNILIVPNKTLANSRVLNYDYPSREVVISVKVGVGYDSNLAQVEKITQEVADETLRNVPGGLAEFKPLLRYEEFGDSAINFTVTLRARAYSDQGLIKHEFIKRLHERYKKEGIVIPYPIRTLDLKPQMLQSIKS
jgi:small-conductance mechanosensitive channel